MEGGCGCTFSSNVAFLHHLETTHNYEDREIAQLRGIIQEDELLDRVAERQARGVMASGRQWPGPADEYPFKGVCSLRENTSFYSWEAD